MQRRNHLVLKIVLTIVVILAILLVAAEFGLRWYLSSSIKNEASSDPSISSSDVDVNFGSTPLLFGVPQGKIPQLTIAVPNTVAISYPDGDDRPPRVTGAPAAILTMEDLNFTNEVAGKMTIDASLTAEYLLASAQKSAVEAPEGVDGAATTSRTVTDVGPFYSPAQYSDGADNPRGSSAGRAPSLSDLFSDSPGDGSATADAFRQKLGQLTRQYLKITAIHPNPSNGTLTFEIAHGVASLELHPEIVGDRLEMKLNDLRLLGFSIPESVVNEMRQGLEKAASVDMEPFHPTKVEVTSRGLHIVQEGEDVDLRKLQDRMSALLPGQAPSGSTTEPNTGAQSNASYLGSTAPSTHRQLASVG